MTGAGSWMMLIGTVILAVGVVMAAWLFPSPLPTSVTLYPDESIETQLMAEAGESLIIVIDVHDPAPGIRVHLTTCVWSPVGGPECSPGPYLLVTFTRFLTETGIYVVAIQNTGVGAVTIDYRVTATSSTERTLVTLGVPFVVIGSVTLVAGVVLRFAWKGLRSFWRN